jgi:hypothetical protein
MSEAIHCDGPDCENWVVKSSTNDYVTLQKNYKYRHFCTYLCLSYFVKTMDLIDGLDD